MNRIRIAVIGTGWWSTRVHLPALCANADCDVVAVADADPRRARQAAAHFGVPHWYAEHRTLLADAGLRVIGVDSTGAGDNIIEAAR